MATEEKVRVGHTPGPWEIVYHAPGATLGRVHIGSPSVGHTIIDTEYRGQWLMSWADAHLVAAAPDLLAALERLLGASACGECDEMSRPPCVYCEARAALAKAHGTPGGE